MSEFFFPISEQKRFYSETYKENLKGLCKTFEEAQPGDIVGLCYSMSVDFVGTATESLMRYVIKTADPLYPLTIVNFADLDKVQVRNVSVFMVELIHDETLFSTFSQDDKVLIALEDGEPGDTDLELLVAPEFFVAYGYDYVNVAFDQASKTVGIDQDTVNNSFLAVVTEDITTSHAFVAAQAITGALEAFGALALKDAKLHMSKENAPDIGLPDLIRLRNEEPTS